MVDCLGAYYFRENRYLKTSLSPTGEFDSGTWIYEVIRVIHGTGIFLEDHVARLNESLRLSGAAYRLELHEAREILRGLVERNSLVTGNIRIMVRLTGQASPLVLMCCVPFSYPAESDYARGVSTALYRAGRTDPNVKQYRARYQEQVSSFLARGGFYEALLVDDRERITEGSRSNVFFIRDGNLVTAPGHAVLKGITREKIILLSRQLNYKLMEEFISIKDLSKIEAVFLTGTSPKVLPVCRIDAHRYRAGHPIVDRIREAFDRLIAAEISGVRGEPV